MCIPGTQLRPHLHPEYRGTRCHMQCLVWQVFEIHINRLYYPLKYTMFSPTDVIKLYCPNLYFIFFFMCCITFLLFVDKKVTYNWKTPLLTDVESLILNMYYLTPSKEIKNVIFGNKISQTNKRNPTQCWIRTYWFLSVQLMYQTISWQILTWQ